jgi:hypothetical protein
VKRSPLPARKAPLRRSRLSPVNRKRRAKRRAEAFGEQAELCRHLPCVVAHSSWWLVNGIQSAVALAVLGSTIRGQSEPHHVPSRGAGGTDKDCVPLSAELHREFHTIGEQSFAAKYAVDLRAIARRIHEVLRG